MGRLTSSGFTTPAEVSEMEDKDEITCEEVTTTKADEKIFAEATSTTGISYTSKS